MSFESDEGTIDDGHTLLTLSVLSGLIWLIVGSLIIYYFQDSSLLRVLLLEDDFLLQVGTGLLSGGVLGVAGVALIRIPIFREILNEYAIIRQVKQMSISPTQIVYVSAIAGFSEEILFRSAIQPVIGIWWTSLLFIGVHGYIRLRSITHILYSLFTFLLSVILGLLFIYFGLISAIIAHFVYDVIALYGIKQVLKSEKLPNDNSSDN